MKNYHRFIASLILGITATLPLQQVSAQGNAQETRYGLNTNFKEISVAQSDDLRGVTANVINIILGFLGILAVILILIAGFKWMTAAGNEDQVRDAKKMIIQATIGLFIIFAAWSIAYFVLTQIRGAVDTNKIINK